MASASALAGAFTTLGVAANKTAKRTNVVAKKVRPRIIPPAMDGRLGDVIRRLSRRETRRLQVTFCLAWLKHVDAADFEADGELHGFPLPGEDDGPAGLEIFNI